MQNRLGYEEGDTCNRAGCLGIIEWTQPECHCQLCDPGSCDCITKISCNTCDYEEEIRV